MDFAFATAPGSDRPNEDHVVVSADWAVVLDGVTRPPGLDTGCVHGPAWLVRQLGDCLVGALTAAPAAPLDRLLLCTDGVSRLTEFFALDWAEVFGIAERSGPGGVIDTVRRHETGRPELLARPGRGPVKQHDDATLAVLLPRP